ncbi:MAG: hypothetical protein OEY11_00725 [Gammaproteobacteria bacterium]|nr:hypothetical protein [Gammaproteobacteria bacterium]
MRSDVLERVYEIIKAAPHSSQSLLLFALLKTLDIQKGGHMYLLSKLKDMTAENRQLAYGLMELMAENQTMSEDWQAKLQLIESAIRSNT